MKSINPSSTWTLLPMMRQKLKFCNEFMFEAYQYLYSYIKLLSKDQQLNPFMKECLFPFAIPSLSPSLWPSFRNPDQTVDNLRGMTLSYCGQKDEETVGQPCDSVAQVNWMKGTSQRGWHEAGHEADATQGSDKLRVDLDLVLVPWNVLAALGWWRTRDCLGELSSG